MGEKKEDKASAGVKQQKVKNLIVNLKSTALSMDYLLNPIDTINMILQMSEEAENRPEQYPEFAKLVGAIGQVEANKESRLNLYFKSSYIQAMKLLQPLKGKYKDAAETLNNYIVSMEQLEELEESESESIANNAITIKEQAILYFFALHTEINAISDIPLTDAQQQEIIDIYYNLDEYYYAILKDRDYTGTEILSAFIVNNNPEPEAAAIESMLPILQAINPAYHTMPNNTLMNDLQDKDPINAGAYDMIVANARKSKSGRLTRPEITAYTMIDLDPGESNITVTKSLSEFERQVSDAIMSLWEESLKQNIPPIIYPDMIYRAMPGGGDKASPQQKEAIIKAIEKFRHLHIYVDATDEMRKRGVIAENETLKFDDFYLTARHVEKGRTKTGLKIVENAYQLTTEPIVLTYCKLTKQLLTVPAEMLQIKKIYEPQKGRKAISNELLPMTANRQAMTGYLARRIAIMRRDEEKAKDKKRARKRRGSDAEEKPVAAFKEQSNTILFDALFSHAGLTDQTKTERNRNREFVFDVLDYWTVCGRIKEYEKQMKGRAIKGVKIYF